MTGLGITGTASVHAMEALQAVHDALQGSGLGWGERPGSSGGSTRVLTPAHGWVLLAVGQAPVSTAGGRLALARDLGGRRVRNRVGLGHALERELRLLALAVRVRPRAIFISAGVTDWIFLPLPRRPANRMPPQLPPRHSLPETAAAKTTEPVAATTSPTMATAAPSAAVGPTATAPAAAPSA